ncbi:MAG: PAS domain S-box protein [Rhodospirillales bacterium]|nr:PAS domain S-box protein [Rhodospirillales bacterium]
MPGNPKSKKSLKTKAQLIAEIEVLENRVASLEKNDDQQGTLLQLAVENSQDILAILDFDGTLEFTSPSFESILGYNQTECLGKTSFDVIHPDDLNKIKSDFAEGINSHKPISTTYRARHKKGHWVEVESSATATKLQDKIKIIVNTRDISERLKAEESLRESENRLARIFNLTPNLMAISNIDTGVYLAVNDAWLKFYGYKREEAIGKSSLKLGNWETLGDRDDFVRELKENGCVKEREVRVITKDKRLHTLLTFAETINFDGRQRILTIALDITDRKKLEQELYQARDNLEERVKARTRALEISEKRFKDFSEVGSDWIWETDKDHKFIFLSGQIEEITENKPESVYGQNRFDNQPPIEIENEPEKWEQHRETLSAHKKFENFQYRYLTKSGKIIHIRVNGNPVFDKENNFLGYRGTGKEVTKEVEAIGALKENEERLRGMLSLAPIGVLITRFDGTILFGNDEFSRLTGKAAGASILDSWVNLDERVRFLEKFKKQGYVKTEESQIFGSDGKPKWIMLSWNSIIIDSEECILAWIYDIDTIKRTEAALQEAISSADQANAAKSDFLAKMSHEFRTPMNAIIGFSDAMRCEVFGPIGNEKYSKYPIHIYDSGKHLLELIDDILDLSKIEAGKMVMNWENVNTKILVENVCSTVQPLAEKNNNSLELICHENVGAIITDYRRLNQILLNLLGNACKFTKKGEISLTVEQEEFKGHPRMVFTVKDNGVGIAPENMKNLFHEFTQGGLNSIQAADGSGLGLAISRRFAELMGGDISAQSTLDVGSIFTLQIPIKTQEENEK